MQKKNMRILMFLLTTMAMAFFGSQSSAFSIKSSTSAGSACNAALDISVSGSESSIVIRYPELNTSKDKGKRLSRVNCNVSITTENSEDRQFRLKEFKTSYGLITGSAEDIKLKISAWFQASKHTAFSELKVPLKPSTTNNWQGVFTGEEWSHCAREMVLNTGVSMIAKSKATLQSESIVEFKDGIEITLEWRQCSGSKK